MILVDANLLLYASLAELPQHERAREWLDGELNGTALVGLPWMSLTAFLRISTNPRLFTKPLAPAEAWRQVVSWLKLPSVWTPQPGSRHAEILGHLIEVAAVKGDLISDAHLAAIAMEHGLTLYSTDSDFARFPALNWRNPLR